jgi:hypothetical protein
MTEHVEAIPRYPLMWPVGWRRTPRNVRQAGRFKQKRQDQAGTTWISAFTATQRLERELDRLGGEDPTLSTNVKVRMDGRPYSDKEPEDAGAAVYFRFKGRATVLACDRYWRVADNIAAIAAHVEAVRAIDRFGVGTVEQALAGYRALPADTAADWRTVFGFAEADAVTAEALQARFRDRAAVAHPDRGGTDEAMAHLNRAREFALAEVLA